jgi:Zn-dependent protease
VRRWVLRRSLPGGDASEELESPVAEATPLVPAILFMATAVSMVVTALVSTPIELFPGEELGFFALLHRLWSDDRARAGALAMAGSLLGILTAHEAGHYVAARLHGVPVSLPHFLPLPLISPFGTMGAVIRMPRPVRDRAKLFDIGVAGPLAGLALAVPLYAYGVSTSVRVPRVEALGHGVELGSSVLSLGIERLFAPAGSAETELVLSPVAFGAWGGLLLTMLNLLPVGQLDGGHVATALFGNRWARGACTVHRLMLVAFFVLAVGPGFAGALRGEPFTMIPHAGRATFWFVWAQIVAVVATTARPVRAMSGQMRVFSTLALAWAGGSVAVRGSEAMTGLWLVAVGTFIALDVTQSGFADPGLVHPEVEGGALGAGRAALAWFTLALFVLLLMPWPMAV